MHAAAEPHKAKRLARLITALALFGAVFGIAACDTAHDWRTSNMKGKLPDLEFQLVNENTRTVTETDYAGYVNLLFFGFTSCPDVCPTTLARLKAVVERLEPAEQLAVRILFVSVDPGRDTPERLKAYTDAFGERIVGLTAKQPALRELTARYASSFSYGEADTDGNYPVQHTSSVFVFDTDGDARLLFRTDDPIDAMASDLEALLP